MNDKIKIYFNLVEDNYGEKPFAFMITCSEAPNFENNIALSDFFQKDKYNYLFKVSVLVSIKNLAVNSKFIKKLNDNDLLLYPIMLTEEEAFEFLKEVYIFESCGIICRIPNWWTKTSGSSKISISLSEKIEGSVNLCSWHNIFRVSAKIIYNDEEISREDIITLLNKSIGLAKLKGKWVRVDKEKLEQLLEQYELLKKDGTTLSEIMNLVINVKSSDIIVEYSHKDWLRDILDKDIANHYSQYQVSNNFNGVLREYQYDAFKWLTGMSRMGFGVCLADDMGLGKTIEILAFLQTYFETNNKKVLLIVPSSLIKNWEDEIHKFTPGFMSSF